MAAAVASRSGSASSSSLVKHLAAVAAASSSSSSSSCRHSSTSTPRRARLVLQQEEEHSTRERQQPDASVLRIKWDHGVDSLSRPSTTTLAKDTHDWMTQFWSDVPTTSATSLDPDRDRDRDLDLDLDQEFLRSIHHEPPPRSLPEDDDDDELAQLVAHIIEANDDANSPSTPPPTTGTSAQAKRIGSGQREHAVASLSRTSSATTTATDATTTRRPRQRHRTRRQARPDSNLDRHASFAALAVLPPNLVRRAPLSSTQSSTQSGIDEAPWSSQWLKRSRAPARSQEGAATRIDPYRPYPLVSAVPHPHAHPHPHTEPQPHHFPLASRNDWRLSSPARFTLRSPPPSTSPSPSQNPKAATAATLPLSSAKETCTLSSGRNRLVGVGPDAARVGKWKTVRAWEGWGWKSRVPEGSAGGKGEWKDADTYVERFQRLLDLSKTSDEQNYLASLARAGSPLERQGKGLTVTRASGTWLTSPSSSGGGGGGGGAGANMAQQRNGEMITTAEKKRTRSSSSSSKNGGGGGGGGGAKTIAEFRTEGGYGVTEEDGFRFESGMVLRITESVEDSSSEDYSGPRPPPPSSSSEITDKWHVQGTLLEVRRDKLVVAFDEVDWWPLDDPGESYQIDIGLDLSSYALQQDALDKLYYDPARQRERNMLETLAVQEEFVLAAEEKEGEQSAAAAAAAGGGGGGTRRQIREWTLQGTELREEIVPSSASSSSEAQSESQENEEAPTPPLLPRPIESDLFRDNQLIHSWIERYRRDDPLVLPGDPDLGLNASQTKAIAMALGDRLSLIQGPPGTGKSQTIVSLIALLKLHFRVPHPILLAAPTHVSVDHLVSLLVRAGLNPLRCGKAHRVSPEVRTWTIEKRQEEHPLWKATEAARVATEEARVKLQEFRDAVRGTKEATNSATIKKDAELTELFRKTWRTFIVREQKLYASLLATADVFCATAVGSGASKVLNMVDFPIVLLDEAAMCTEPVSLIPLMKGAQHATLIGDHKQLPAVVTSKEARRERLHTSLFERLLQSGTVNSTLLDTQYRMRPAISSFPNDSFYQGALRDASIVEERPPPLKSRFLLPQLPEAPGSSPAAPASELAELDGGANLTSSPTIEGEPFPVSFVAHSSPESTHRQSLLNRGESDLLITIVGDLLAANPDLVASDIGIISPYYAQMRLVSNSFSSGYASARLGQLLDPDRAASVVDVEVNTVDGFQGREKRVVLLSTVRSNKGGWIGFLNDKRRLNVALTRARDALIVVGNEQTLRRAAARAAPLTVPPPLRSSQVLRALSEEEEGAEGGIFAAAAAADAADPDADPRIWADFLDWCQERGIVQRWEASPVPA